MSGPEHSRVGDVSNAERALQNAVAFEREARAVPEEYYEGSIPGPDADLEMAELAHLSEVAREIARRGGS